MNKILMTSLYGATTQILSSKNKVNPTLLSK